MSVIDTTYFITDCSLPVGTFSDLQLYIDRYEKELLISLLGYESWKEFNDAYLASIALAPTPLPEKWDWLVNGKEYTKDGRLIKWNGLKNDDKISCISNYVFCKYVTSKQVAQTSTGAVIAKQENAEKADNTHKVVKVWNDFISLYSEAVDFLIEHSEFSTYTTTYKPIDIYGL